MLVGNDNNTAINYGPKLALKVHLLLRCVVLHKNDDHYLYWPV